MVLVGRVARPHGLAGHVVINAETDFPEERFAPGSGCWLGTAAGAERVVVAASRLQNGRPILVFAGMHTVADAERTVGLELRIPEAQLRPLAEGTYYHHQLVGCAVETAAGAQVGAVVKVDGGGGAGGSLLVVEGSDGEVLIPLAGPICAEVDVATRRIVVTPPEGLLELNVTPRRSPHDGRRRGRRG
jgi:16S rRNA processing protein RimM